MKCRFAASVVLLLAAASVGNATWEDSALAALKKNDPAEARKIARTHEDERAGQILLFASSALEYDQSKASRDMARATTLYRDLLRQVTVEDAVLLHSLRQMNGSLLHSYSETLLDQALRRVQTPAQAKAVPAALAVIYPSERSKVFAGLSDWLSVQRERLLKGEQLDAETQKVFTDEKLIASLLGAIETKKKNPQSVPKTLATPKPPPKRADGSPQSVTRMLPPRTNASARECLVLIEEPAIPQVRAALPELGDDGVALLSELCAAKSLRESRQPGFIWSAPCGE